MPYPQPPQQGAGNKKYQRRDGQQPVPRRSPVKEVLQGPVLHQRQGHQEGKDYQHRLAVDAEGVFAATRAMGVTEIRLLTMGIPNSFSMASPVETSFSA